MKEHPLIGLGKFQNVTRFLGSASLHVPQKNDRSLTAGKGVDRVVNVFEKLSRSEPLLRGGEVPRPRRFVPRPRRAEPSWIDGRLAGSFLIDLGKEDHPTISNRPGPGAVGQDAEDPCPETRSSFEAIQSLQDGEPGLLDHLIGRRRALDEGSGQPDHCAMVSANELPKCLFVTALQARDEPRLIFHEIGDPGCTPPDGGALRSDSLRARSQ